MKKILLLLLLLGAFFVKGFSQPPNPAIPPGPNLQGLKIAFITRQLALTTDEAQKFWPVYYDYSDDMRRIRSEEKDDVIAFEEKLLDLRKKFKADVKKILGTEERANKALTLERDFNNVVKKELQERIDLRNKRGNNNK